MASPLLRFLGKWANLCNAGLLSCEVETSFSHFLSLEAAKIKQKVGLEHCQVLCKYIGLLSILILRS
jgi:hypothetical protein